MARILWSKMGASAQCRAEYSYGLRNLQPIRLATLDVCTVIARLCLGRCGTLIEKTGTKEDRNYCNKCRKPDNRPANPRYSDTVWRKISKAARAAQPWCTYCKSKKDLTVDHVIAGSLDGGVMVLCRSCNSSKGNKEAKTIFNRLEHPSSGLGPWKC